MKKRMFAKAIKIMIEKTMSLHDYIFDGQIIRQKAGGSIGLDLTGVVADIYMDYWDSHYTNLLRERNILPKLYKRYKDDINLVLKIPSYDNTKGRCEIELNTLENIMTIANEIHPSIRVTGDIPSNYPDDRLPILDLKVWIGEVGNDTYKVVTSHYMKDVSTRAVINERSSHPENMKRNVLTNEVLRILRNCNEYHPWNETADHISYFMKRLQFSGYNQEFRYSVLKKAIKRYEARQQETGRTEQPTRIKRKNHQNNNETVMFVQATPNEEMKKEIQRCAGKHKIALRIQEKVNSSVKRELQKSNPFKQKECGSEKCQICKQGKGVNCRARGCVYEMECNECNRKYRGQTGNSIRERFDQHLTDWERKESSSPLYRHSQLFHNGNKFPVSIKLLKQCFGDATRRKITESVLIDKLSSSETMNGKNEWTYIKLNKISASN